MNTSKIKKEEPKKEEPKKEESKKPESKKPESKKPESKNRDKVFERPDRRKNLLPIKTPPRDPKRKPNTKIFDIIGDILKTPYIIRGGKADGGRIKKMGGGSLKAVPADKKGLKKLPTQVRNKMGYMKTGGRVGLKSGGAAKRGRGCEIR